MAILLLAAFIGLPLIEIWVFIEVGGQIGALSTVGLCILTAVVGTFFIRQQGLQTLNRVREEMERGTLNADPLLDGLCLLIAGAFLLTPGFVTDSFGFLLLLPPVRAWIKLGIVAQVAARAEMRHRQGPGPGRGDGRVIDGEFEDLSAENDNPSDGPDDGRNGDGSRRLPR